VAAVDRHEVLLLYDEGVDRFAALAGRLHVPEEWLRPACGTWTAAQLARHVLAVAGWYHAWLDRAERGDAAPPFLADQLAEQNARALEALGDVPGPDAVTEFVGRARAYRDRVVAAWDLPYGYPRGTVTAGLHAGMAACEWHLHTWDLARSRGLGHQPSDPGTLYAAAGACLARAQGGLGAQVTAALIPVGSRLGPWRALLKRSGRSPVTGD
jgi:hypothetical protein